MTRDEPDAARGQKLKPALEAAVARHGAAQPLPGPDATCREAAASGQPSTAPPAHWSLFAVLSCALVLCVWFLTLGMRHLLPSDEGRYAEIAREMAVSGDWVTIRYNGLKYFEKPPLHLWMTALAFKAFGVGDWQARLWAAISGIVGIAIIALAAHRWFGRTVAWLTGAVLVSSPAWNIGGHFNSLDIGVSAALACVLGAVLLAQHPLAHPASQRAWMRVAWLSIAAAILTKGLIGTVLPALVLVVYTLLSRDWALWRRLHIASGLPLMLLATAPWFVLVSMRNPEFPQFFFIHEHWQRYTSTVHRHAAPAWYFVPLLLVGFLPWLGLSARLPGVLRGDAATGFKPRLLLAVWAVAIFTFFSLSGSKLPGYIMPMFPALAVLAALALQAIGRKAWQRQLAAMLCVAGAGLLAAPLMARLGNDETPNALYRNYAVWVAAGMALAVVALLLAWSLNRRGRTLASIGAAAAGWFLATTVVMVGHETMGRSSAGITLLQPMQALLTPAMPIYSVRLLNHTLPFYLQHTMVMVEEPSELEFGTQREPHKWLPTVAAFKSRWTDGPHALAVMEHDTFAALQQQQLTMFPVARDVRRVVVANFAPQPR